MTDFDFSSMEEFWKITRFLLNEKEPTEEQWTRLFETPGYATLIENEFPKEFFMKYFPQIFMPSKSLELQEELRDGTNEFRKQLLNHYIYVKENQLPLKEYQNNLRRNKTDILKEMLEKALNLLPMEKMLEIPEISFVIFQNDARGYSPIVIDLGFAYQLGSILPLLLAHESHHYYRNRLLTFNMDNIKAEDKDIMWVLNQLQAEGIADQIDKHEWFYSNAGKAVGYENFAQKFKLMVAKAPETLEEINKILKEISITPNRKEELGKELKKKVPISGHPTGFFMTTIILKELGKASLVDNIGNPFEFIRLYNEAVNKGGKNVPTFSREAMSVLSELEAENLT